MLHLYSKSNMNQSGRFKKDLKQFVRKPEMTMQSDLLMFDFK